VLHGAGAGEQRFNVSDRVLGHHLDISYPTTTPQIELSDRIPQ